MNRFFLLCIVLSLLNCCRKNPLSIEGPDKTAFLGDAWYFTAENPILKGMDVNPIAKISVRVPVGQGETSIDGLQLQLSADTELEDLEKIEVYTSGSNPDFSGSVLAATVSKLERQMDVVFKRRLTAGENYFWITGKAAAGADVRHTVSVQCPQINLSPSGPLPVKVGMAKRQYIGWALRRAGQNDVHTYRIPGLATSKKGTLLAVYDRRYEHDRDLPANVDVALTRSTDGGQTWSPDKIILDMGPGANDGVGDPAILVDHKTGAIWVAALWSHGNRGWNGSGPGMTPDETGQFILVKSEDDGLTWSAPVNVTAQMKSPAWRLFFQGPGMGICLDDGTLVFAAQYKDAAAMPFSTIVSSKDGGKTWQVGTGAKSNTTEAQVVALNDGSLMLNMRDNRGSARSVATTRDFGKTWTEHPSSRSALPEPICMGSIIRVASTQQGDARNILAFSNPNDTRERKSITIKLSLDEGNTWPEAHQLLVDARKCYGYSCLTRIDANTLGLLYEGNRDLYFVSVPLQDILSR